TFRARGKWGLRSAARQLTPLPSRQSGIAHPLGELSRRKTGPLLFLWWTVRRSFRLAGVLLLGLLSVRRNLGALLVGAVRHPSFIDGARGAGFPMEGCGRAPHVEDLSALHLPLLSLPGVLCHSFGRPDSRTPASEFRAPTMLGGAAQRRPVRRPRL